MLTVQQVKDYLGITPADDADDAWLSGCVDSINALIPSLPVVADSLDPAVWPEPVTLGATMLAGHWYQSRSAPYGRASLDIAGAYQTAYADPEISRLLQLRRWAPPKVG